MLFTSLVRTPALRNWHIACPKSGISIGLQSALLADTADYT